MSTLDKDLQALVARFEEGVSADPTQNMSPEDAAKWKAMNEEHRDKFKTAAYGDPYWMTAKYPGKAKDGTPIKKGDRVFYYPRTKTMLVGPEAEKASREFGAMSFDEDFGFRAAGFSVEMDNAWFAFVGNAPFNKDTIEAIRRINDIPFKDDEGVLHDEGGVALRVMKNEYSGPLTYAQEKAGQVRENVVQVEFVKGMDKKKVLQALQEVGKKFKLKVETMTGYKKPQTRGKKAAEMSDLSFLATLDMELTASALPGAGIDRDAAAIEEIAKLAKLDHTANRMVAQTILDQMGGQRRLQVMLGVTMFNILASGNPGVGIQWPNKQRSKGNYVEIRLNGSDLYDVKFFNRGGTAPMKLVKAYDDVYAEDLADIFERQTGWYLRMASDQAHQLVRAAGARGPSPKGRDWKQAGPGKWSWHDRTTGILFTVQEMEGPGIPIYVLKVFHPNHGMFKHIKPFQWKNPEGAFQAAAWEYPKWTEQFANNDLTEHWSKVGAGMKKGFGDSLVAEGCPDNLSESECAEWESNTTKYEDKFKAAFVEGIMAEGCPDNLDESECKEWELNTLKYQDVVKDQAKTAYEEGSRVPDGWDNGQIEGKDKTDEPGEEGSDTPDGNGNQKKRAGKKPTPAEKAEAEKLFKKWRAEADGAEMDDLDESWQNFLDGDLSLKDLKANPPTKEASSKVAEVIEEMYALVTDDGYMLGATDDWHDARSKSYWRPFVDEDHVAEGKLMTLANVPLHLAEKFKDMGTSAQMFDDGYAAWKSAKHFVKGPGTKLAAAEKEAATGLYGHTKRIQADCEGCVRKVQKSATNIARTVYARNAQVAEFLATHARRADSLPAKILVSALQGMGPKVASEVTAVEDRESRLAELRMKQAASKSLAHRTLLNRLATVNEVPLASFQEVHMAKLLEAAEDLQKLGLVTFDGVTVAKVTDADAQTGEGIKETTDKNASGSGASNAKYLAGLAPPMKAKILAAVAKHYGTSVSAIEGEVTDSDAEALYEYLAFDHGLAMQVYRDFQKMRLASGPCLEGHAVALLQRISQTAYHDDLRSLFEKELGIPTREFSEHLMALDMAKMISLQKASGPKGKTLMVYRPTPAGLAYLADVKAGKTAARTYGLYGYSEKVAKLGLQACADLRHEAGKVAHDLHTRRTAHYAAINDFFANHSKTAKCMYSKLLSASYPELKEAKTASSIPQTVQGWLEWDLG